ncbi:hypothetical protein BB559_003431 [Furculomyces boomerangus]|uniref:Uncharacterized protein n=2 Tax=Harpellales TaxID=61421 RepID=A0A2T9YLE2_9FUNG|nr:hypothetical protein BB559_003431 [Furculomyces boomerangus]PVZ99456.1 hypothetical protein BB558_004436 [Smittium angustum]
MARNIWIAISNGDLEPVKSFIQNKEATVDSQDDNGYSCLHAAASWKNSEITKYLLDNGANVNITDNDGDTPLHMCESAECALLLLKAGADAKILNNEGKTAVDSILENKEFEVAKAVCEYTGIPFVEPEEEADETSGTVDTDRIEINSISDLASEESLNKIMSYIMSNADNVDLSDEDTLKAMVSEYLMQAVSSKNTSSKNNDTPKDQE